MSNRSRTWLKVAAILSIITCVAMLVASVLILTNLFGAGDIFADLFRKMIVGMSPSDVTFYKISVTVNCVLAIVINALCASSYLKVSKVKYPTINEYRSLFNSAIIQLFFGETFIPAIIALVVASRNRHIILTNPNKKEDKMETLTLKVGELKKLKEDGVITDEQFNAQLNNLLNEHVKK